MNGIFKVMVIAAGIVTLALPGSAAAYYSPALGRFAQRDPVGYVDGMNLYQYVVSNPVKFGDPSGNIPWGGLTGGHVTNTGNRCIMIWRDPGGYMVLWPGESSPPNEDTDYVYDNGTWLKVRNFTSVGFSYRWLFSFRSGAAGPLGPYRPDADGDEFWPGNKAYRSPKPPRVLCQQLCECNKRAHEKMPLTRGDGPLRYCQGGKTCMDKCLSGKQEDLPLMSGMRN